MQIGCEARGCIRNKLSVHLSSAGCFLFVPLILTSSRQSLCSAPINAIIDATRAFVNRKINIVYNCETFPNNTSIEKNKKRGNNDGIK